MGNVKIYHIIHMDRLGSVIRTGGLISDAEGIRLGVEGTTIGMNQIKSRRLEIPVAGLQGVKVGDCVPFYFCPRSVMLYVIMRGNHPDLLYRGGQQPILHLVFDLGAVVEWAAGNNRQWAFSDCNAASRCAVFHRDLAELAALDWEAINAVNWQTVRERKQAEFLLAGACPWELVEGIGVYSPEIAERTRKAIAAAGAACPPVEVRPDWYY